MHALLLMVCARLGLAILSDAEIEGGIEWERDGLVIRRGGPLDVRHGMLLVKSGFLEKKRWLSPEIKTKILSTSVSGKGVWRRIYRDDWAGECKSSTDEDERGYKNRFHRALIDAFPSAGGVLSMGSEARDSLYQNLVRRGMSWEKRAEFMGVLMVAAQGSDVVCRTSGKKRQTLKVIKGGKVCASITRTRLSKLRRVVCFLAGRDRFNHLDPDSCVFLLSREALIQAIIYLMFDGSRELRVFYDTFYRLARNDPSTYNRCFAGAGLQGSSDALWVAELHAWLGSASLFPFTSLSPPPSNASVRGYNRSSRTFTGETFSDCVESALMAFVCCIFFDPCSGQYDLRACADGPESRPLTGFFAKYRRPFTVTHQVREDWARVVEDLPDPDAVYCKNGAGCKNEIDTGLINFLRILLRVTGLDPSDYLLEFGDRETMPVGQEREHVLARFTALFEAVAKRLGGEKIICIPDTKRLCILRIGHGTKWDVFGSVEMEVVLANGDSVAVELEHDLMHSVLKIARCPLLAHKKVQSKLLRCANKILSTFDTEQDYLLAASVRMLLGDGTVLKGHLGQVERMINNGNYEPLFATTLLQSDEQKYAILSLLQPYIMIADSGSNVLQFVRNILNSLTLLDKTVFTEVHASVAFSPQLRKEYAGYLQLYPVRRGELSKARLEWTYDLGAAMTCIASFYDTEEIYTYFMPEQIAHALALRRDANLLDRMEKTMDPDDLQDVCVHGFIAAAGEDPSWHLMDRCFRKLDIDNCASRRMFNRNVFWVDEEAVPHHICYFRQLEKDCGTPPRAIRTIFYWCFSPRWVDLYLDHCAELIFNTHQTVGIPFICDCIVACRKDKLARCLGSTIPFFHSLLIWAGRNEVSLGSALLKLIRELVKIAWDKVKCGDTRLFEDKLRHSEREYVRLLEQIGALSAEAE